jgi:hypothetical protein
VGFSPASLKRREPRRNETPNEPATKTKPMIKLPELAPNDRHPATISNRKSISPYLRLTATKQTKAQQISNRESLRLEIHVTPTKQRIDHVSNREKAAVFQAAIPPPAPTPHSQKGEQKANRESLRLEIVVTQRKQKPGLISNREKAAVFQAAIPPPAPTPHSQKGEQKANREPLRLEINLTSTKQRPDHLSNREETPLFAGRLIYTRIADFSRTAARSTAARLQPEAEPARRRTHPIEL